MFGEHLHHVEPESFDRPRFIISAAAAAAKWETNASAAEQTWSTNLQATTKDIVGNAIAKQSVAKANYAASLDSGRWAAALQRVGNQGIKQAAAAKSGNYATGIAASATKMQTVFSKLLPYIAAGIPAIDAMPSGTIANSKARASAWIDYMAAGKGSFGA